MRRLESLVFPCRFPTQVLPQQVPRVILSTQMYAPSGYSVYLIIITRLFPFATLLHFCGLYFRDIKGKQSYFYRYAPFSGTAGIKSAVYKNSPIKTDGKKQPGKNRRLFKKIISFQYNNEDCFTPRFVLI